MPPHCDTLDGPVVTTARKALEAANANLILPWVPAEAERELCEAFEKTLRVRSMNDEAKALADYWFFETVVRLHREGEGAPYTGLKPAGLDEGPVILLAEKGIEQGDAHEVIHFIAHHVEHVLEEKYHAAIARKNYDINDVAAAREYVEAMLGVLLFSHHLYMVLENGAEHGDSEHSGHGGYSEHHH